MGAGAVTGYNFTDRVRKCLQMAREEATRLRHGEVRPDHILLGIIDDGQGVGIAALENLGVDLKALRETVARGMETGTSDNANPDLPYTGAAKRVLEWAMAEARMLRHSYVGTEHPLLGVLRNEKGVGGQELRNRGADLDKTRAEVLRLVGSEQRADPAAGPLAAQALTLVEQLRSLQTPDEDRQRALLDELEGILRRLLIELT